MTRVVHLLWLALLAGVAFVAVNGELDRASRRDPDLADLVLPPFRSFAQALRVSRELHTAPPAQVLADATLLVRRRPLPSEHLTMLAVAEQRAGLGEKSLQTIQLAAARGWRDAVAQHTILTLALNAGADDDAATRLEALWASGEDTIPVADDTAAVLSTPAGQQAVGARLARSDNWAHAFLGQTVTRVPPESLAPTVVVAMQHGARFDCGTLGALAKAYVHNQHEAAGRLLLAQRCDGRPLTAQ